MRFWIGTCIIFAPTIILPAAMNGWPGAVPIHQLTEEQKTQYRQAYAKEDYFICSKPVTNTNVKSTCQKNEEILKKITEKLSKKD